MAFRKWIMLVLVLVVFKPLEVQAGWLDFLNSAPDETDLECGQKLDEMRSFLSKVRVCRRDEDCMSITGFCPIGCNIYFNQLFQKDVEKDLVPLKESCNKRVCAYECNAKNITPARPVCRKNRCVGTTIKEK